MLIFKVERAESTKIKKKPYDLDNFEDVGYPSYQPCDDTNCDLGRIFALLALPPKQK